MSAYAVAIAFVAILATFATVSIHRARERRVSYHRPSERRHRLSGWWRR